MRRAGTCSRGVPRSSIRLFAQSRQSRDHLPARLHRCVDAPCRTPETSDGADPSVARRISWRQRPCRGSGAVRPDRRSPSSRARIRAILRVPKREWTVKGRRSPWSARPDAASAATGPSIPALESLRSLVVHVRSPARSRPGHTVVTSERTSLAVRPLSTHPHVPHREEVQTDRPLYPADRDRRRPKGVSTWHSTPPS